MRASPTGPDLLVTSTLVVLAADSGGHVDSNAVSVAESWLLLLPLALAYWPARHCQPHP